ncbi:vigilin [Nephila pilipes]|uniref:Vigilin n=1 Tax=Nephila pilipes TaxID=299642 RepID=A0A8X6JXL8_NEPPI|nr:vigilin [Nephila pilipes]
MNEEMEFINFSIEVPIYKQYHKFIIGKGGENINIRDETITKIDLQAEGAEFDVIAIRGPKEGAMKAKKRLLEIRNNFFGTLIAEIKANPDHHKF